MKQPPMKQPPMKQPPMKHICAFLAVVLLVVVGSPAVAGADPAEPTSDRSRVDRIEPAADGIEVEVVGGDSFLSLTVEPGHEVVVPGYVGEPYLRVLEDGTVEQNLRSEATYLNEDRYGAVETPDDLDAGDDPEWEEVADDGSYAWHDHRIHWMSPDRPPGASAGDVIQEWEVPLVVDGTEVVAHGTLVWVDPISPVPWIGLIVVAAALTFLASRGRSITMAVALALVAAVVAGGVAWAERASVPAGAAGSPLPLIIAAIALAGGVLGAVAITARRPAVGALMTLLSLSALGGWVLLRFSVLLEPVLPTDLDPTLDRAGTALAAGIAIGAAIVTVRSDALAVRPPPAET